MKNNGKATIQKLYDEVIPIIKEIAVHTTKIEDMEEDLRNIKDDMKSKISIKAFASWLSALAIIVGIITAIIAMR